MNTLQVGYAEVNINPPLGIGVYGYYVPRFAKGFLDDLVASALALTLGETTIMILALDICEIESPEINCYATAVSDATGIPKENIVICATHTHTGPFISTTTDYFETPEEPIREYSKFLSQRVADAAKLALAELKPAKMGYIVGWAPDRVAYIRRYKMKDGTTVTCPPIDDPNIDHPIGELDQRVNVLRFDREGAESVVLVNYGIHADTIGGEYISADFPSWMRKTIDKALDGTKCMFIPGAQGDVGSTNVHPKDGDMNDTEISFDNEMKSPGMARFVGRALAGTVLQVFDKVHYAPVNCLRILHKEVQIPTNKATAEELPLAHQYKALHEAGRDDEIPFDAMELTTVVAEALRMCSLEDAPDNFTMDLVGVQIGSVAMVGIPGEPFTDIGVGIKEAEGWPMIMPCALTNGCAGYFPMQSAYDEGGYEARASIFKAGVGERLVQGGKDLLYELKNN